MPGTEQKDRLKLLKCPGCETVSEIAQIDLIPGYARIEAVYEDGSYAWGGETEVDWDMQRPASNPPEFVCLACNRKLTREELVLVDETA